MEWLDLSDGEVEIDAESVGKTESLHSEVEVKTKRRRRRRRRRAETKAGRSSSQETMRGRRKRARKAPEGVEDVPRCLREVYVGGLLWKDADEETIAEGLNAAFQALPDFQHRYPELRRPVYKVHLPKDEDPSRARANFASAFVFVEFVDRLLARSALQLSGLRLAGRSVRIAASAQLEVQGDTLDVEPLRQLEKLPAKGGPGAQMLLNVWIGCVPMRVREETHGELGLEQQINEAVLKLPGVQKRYGDLRPVKNMRSSDCKRYVFVEVASELIASSMVFAEKLVLENGLELHTGWPAAAVRPEERAPPPLAADGSISTLKEEKEEEEVLADEEDFGERLDCEVFLGGVQTLKVEDIWESLVATFLELPSYAEHFPDLSCPVVNIRVGAGSFGFTRTADPRLASTLIDLKELRIKGKKVALRRPANCKGALVAGLHLNRAPAPPRPPPQVKEVPPQPPAVPYLHHIWIGNLPGREKLLCESDEEDEKLPDKEAMRRRLDRHLNELAMAAEGFNLEDGPPIKRLKVHGSGNFAFLQLVGSQERVEKLFDAIDGKDFMGQPLAMNWSKHQGVSVLRPRRPLDVPPGVKHLLRGVREL